jgi:ABC-type branched-subunit amino acid transport system substrate-binding protein
MDRRRTRLCRSVAAGLAIALLGLVVVASPTSAGVRSQVRGFDGTTLKVGSLGNVSQLAGSDDGAQARINRFNDDNEINGVKIEYVGYADDHADPATALSEARRLVSQEQVFAIVGDTSSYNPYDFLAQNKVPFFGWGFEKAYCHPTVTTNVWGFGFNACQVNPDPTVAVDYARQLHEFATKKLGKTKVTEALIANDTDTGKTTTEANRIAAEGRGFDVVYAKASVPPPPVGDYSPYVQDLMTANNGQPPDVVRCLMGLECLTIYNGMQQQGFKGVFNHSLYTDALVKALGGSTAIAANANLTATDIPALNQMREEVLKVNPSLKIDNSAVAGYGSTDMFIKALKKVAKGGKSKITPENVQKAASKMTWGLKDFVGPTVYPVGSNRQIPYCTSIVESDGTQWTTVEDYSCSNKTYPMKKK